MTAKNVDLGVWEDLSVLTVKLGHIMALKSGQGLTVPLKVSKCTGSRGAGDVKGFVLDFRGAVTPWGEKAVTPIIPPSNFLLGHFIQKLGR